MLKKTVKLAPLLALLAASLALSSCGRKGDLDPPSVAAQADTKYGKQGATQPAQPDKPFVLDPLL
ncbi:LPS translocon maturation chaperone LptM [Gellertiella hungarica]|uniref:Putative small lipoprotein YifL n=1 Tax=Gellertiella hungarica TaxID=1572859 RepID=A0A7W6J6Z9_9HYPH|nr:lipoprotein [Gellertiella hungarica]MBB4065117.1 putative small lipoprotein YifL [Gellertiella hungarica]